MTAAEVIDKIEEILGGLSDGDGSMAAVLGRTAEACEDIGTLIERYRVYGERAK